MCEPALASLRELMAVRKSNRHAIANLRNPPTALLEECSRSHFGCPNLLARRARREPMRSPPRPCEEPMKPLVTADAPPAIAAGAVTRSGIRMNFASAGRCKKRVREAPASVRARGRQRTASHASGQARPRDRDVARYATFRHCTGESGSRFYIWVTVLGQVIRKNHISSDGDSAAERFGADKAGARCRPRS